MTVRRCVRRSALSTSVSRMGGGTGSGGKIAGAASTGAGSSSCWLPAALAISFNASGASTTAAIPAFDTAEIAHMLPPMDISNTTAAVQQAVLHQPASRP